MTIGNENIPWRWVAETDSKQGNVIVQAVNTIPHITY